MQNTNYKQHRHFVMHSIKSKMNFVSQKNFTKHKDV